MRILRRERDQLLIDVIASRGPEKSKADILAQRSQVRDGVVDQFDQQQHDQDGGDNLDGHRAIARIVEKLAQPECLARGVGRFGHTHS